MLTNNTVLVHFDPCCPVGISCDASESGVGAALFHRYKDNSECPIANASKTLTDAEKRYPQIQKEALAVYHLCTQEVPPVPVWAAVHPSDIPQATHLHVRSKHCNTDASCQSSCQMVPDAQPVRLHN